MCNFPILSHGNRNNKVKVGKTQIPQVNSCQLEISVYATEVLRNVAISDIMNYLFRQKCKAGYYAR